MAWVLKPSAWRPAIAAMSNLGVPVHLQFQLEPHMTGRIEKTVFISYRRTNMPWALAIYQNLTAHGQAPRHRDALIHGDLLEGADDRGGGDHQGKLAKEGPGDARKKGRGQENGGQNQGNAHDRAGHFHCRGERAHLRRHRRRPGRPCLRLPGTFRRRK